MDSVGCSNCVILTRKILAIQKTNKLNLSCSQMLEHLQYCFTNMLTPIPVQHAYILASFSTWSVINNPDFANYLGQMYPAELEIKDTTESNTSRVTVSCALPFTTYVTISTSISQTFRSRVAIFHLRQPMVFLSHSSYCMPGLASLMIFYFKGGAAFI